MATFVEITPDAFTEQFHRANKEGAVFANGKKIGRVTLPQSHVRRPVRGIQIKDETYATIQVRTASGRPLPLFDAAGMLGGTSQSPEGAGQTYQNSNFLIQSVQEQRVEKQQIVMTFGEPYIFFFGEQPRVLQISGVLLNTADFNWRAEWWQNYDLYLRGTQCVRKRARVVLSWDDIVVEGYILQANAADEASNTNVVQFQFQMFLTNYENISSIGDPEGHLGVKDINLNPETIEFQNSLGQGYSTTLAVRNENVMGGRLDDGYGKNSLLQSLRDSAVGQAFAQGTARLAEIQGQVVDILAEAGRFVSGRNIRVPLGFEGSGVFDEASLALASIAAQTANVAVAGGQVRVRQFWADQITVPARYGPLHMNEDEFVARFIPSTVGAAIPPELYRDQQGEGAEIVEYVRDVFEEYGIDVEPPDEAVILATRAAFGIVSIGVGVGLNAVTGESGTARFVANLL
jgi:hypothetical protein